MSTSRRRGTLSRPRALAALTLATALLAPAASFAFVLVCQDGYLVYKCNDGTIIPCSTTDDLGNTYQVDCSESLGGFACEGHGGLVGVVPSPDTFVAEYTGQLAIADLAGDGDVNSTVTATWVLTCQDQKAFTCDDDLQSCPKAFPVPDERCAQHGGAESSIVLLAFEPIVACDSVAMDLNQNGTSDCCEDYGAFSEYVTTVRNSCKAMGPPPGYVGCESLINVVKKIADLSTVCP